MYLFGERNKICICENFHKVYIYPYSDYNIPEVCILYLHFFTKNIILLMININLNFEFNIILKPLEILINKILEFYLF